MTKPYLKIQQREPLAVYGTEIVLVCADGQEIDLSGIVRRVVWEHEAGDVPRVQLECLQSQVQLASDDIKMAIVPFIIHDDKPS